MSFLTRLVKPLAYISLPVIFLRTAHQMFPMARYYIRVGIYLSTIGLCSAWGALVSICMTLIGRRFDINWVTARSFAGCIAKVLGINFQVEGEEFLETRPAIILGNHQSMVDIAYLGRIFPKSASILGKKELRWIPLLGQFMTLSGAVFVDRGNNAKAVQSLTKAGRTMKARGTSLFVFPEGTRSNKETPDLLPFKKGAFHLAVNAGVPIIPIVCENYWHLYHKGVLEGGTLKIKVLPPVPTEGLTSADIPDLINNVRNKMLEALHEISGKQPKGGVKTDVTPPLPLEEKEPEQQSIPTEPQPTTAAAAAADIPEKGAQTPLTASTLSLRSSRREGADMGAETEEDEELVMVDRPTS